MGLAYATNAKISKKTCHTCNKEIKRKPLIFDDYYFCNDNNGVCKSVSLFGKDERSVDGVEK